ncbi:MAG: hypothetical protein QMD80_07885, partial [archaeon]|nr:hypothetical protein [archaeon]
MQQAPVSSGLFLILILILYITAPFVRLLGKEINRVGEDRVIKEYLYSWTINPNVKYYQIPS